MIGRFHLDILTWTLLSVHAHNVYCRGHPKVKSLDMLHARDYVNMDMDSINRNVAHSKKKDEYFSEKNAVSIHIVEFQVFLTVVSFRTFDYSFLHCVTISEKFPTSANSEKVNLKVHKL